MALPAIPVLITIGRAVVHAYRYHGVRTAVTYDRHKATIENVRRTGVVQEVVGVTVAVVAAGWEKVKNLFTANDATETATTDTNDRDDHYRHGHEDDRHERSRESTAELGRSRDRDDNGIPDAAEAPGLADDGFVDLGGNTDDDSDDRDDSAETTTSPTSPPSTSHGPVGPGTENVGSGGDGNGGRDTSPSTSPGNPGTRGGNSGTGSREAAERGNGGGGGGDGPSGDTSSGNSRANQQGGNQGATRGGDAGDGTRGGGSSSSSGGGYASQGGNTAPVGGPNSNPGNRGSGSSRSGSSNRGGSSSSSNDRGGGDGPGGGNSGGGNSGGGFKPIVFDLDGDGVELVALDESAAFYDINADGYLYNLGWAHADDALLAFDKNADGIINRKDEISFVDYVPGARTDLEGLAHFDSNADGVLDSRDANFGKFRVWQDANQNGVSEAGELRALADAGIDRIELNYAPGDDGQAEARAGNAIAGEGRYHKANGAIGKFADVSFATSAFGFRVDDNELEFKSADGVGKMHVAPAGGGAVNMNFASAVNVAHIGAIGGGGDDVLSGAGVARDLLLFGDDGDDRLTGGSGDDWLAGGAGADTLRGGDGHDILFFDAADDVHGGSGQDIGVVSGDGDIDLSMSQAGLEALHSGGGDDRLRAGDSALYGFNTFETNQAASLSC